MPVEIKELVIRTVVENPAVDGGARDGDGGPGAADAAPGPALMQDLVQECVREVVRILNRTRER